MSSCLVPVGLLVGAPAHAQQPVEIVTPEAGAVVPPDFSVKITYQPQLFGDTDIYDVFTPNRVELIVDDTVHTMCDPCPEDSEVTFDVTLPAGPHLLKGHAWLDFGFDDGAYSDPIMITVEQATTSGSSSGTGTTSGSSDAGETSGTGKPVDTTTSDGTATGQPADTTTGDAPTTGRPADSTAGDGTTGAASDGASSKGDACACDVNADYRGALVWLGAALLAIRRRARGRRS